MRRALWFGVAAWVAFRSASVVWLAVMVGAAWPVLERCVVEVLYLGVRRRHQKSRPPEDAITSTLMDIRGLPETPE